MAYTIFKTIATTEPKRAAQVGSIILAADKGIPNETKEIEGGWLLIPDDGRAIFFQKI